MNKYTCRWCGKEFIANPQEENKLWVKRATNFYYHKNCWEQFLDTDLPKTNEQWLDFLFYLITHHLKGKYNFHQIQKQFFNLIDKKMTGKGIYFTFYWYFILKNNEWKAEYGIGIIPFVYEEATDYWITEEKKKKGILKEMEALIARQGQIDRTIEVHQTKKKKYKQIESPF